MSNLRQINNKILEEAGLSKIIDEEIEDIEGEPDVLIKIPVKEMAEKFIDDYQIIWHDPNMNCSENQEYLQRFRTNYKVHQFDNWENCSEFILKQKIKTFIITSGTNGENLIDKVHELDYVNEIFIFCQKTEKYLYLKKKFKESKINFVKKDFSEIFQEFHNSFVIWSTNTKAWRGSLPAFVPIFNTSDISRLNKQLGYLVILRNFQNRKQAMKDFIALSKIVSWDPYNIDEFQRTYNEYNKKMILNWYSKISFLYKVTNHCLRIGTPDSILYCRLILKDIGLAIIEQYEEKSKRFYGIVYRAACISDDELKNLEENIGKDIQMNGFISTTKNRKMAHDFIHNDPNKVLITIIIPGAEGKLGEQGFAELEEYSDFPYEKEILFNIMSRFKVLSVTRRKSNSVNEDTTNIVLLYGAYELSIYLYQNKSAIEIKRNDITNMVCFRCKVSYNRHDYKRWFLNIQDQMKIKCEDCYEKNKINEKDDDEDLMLMLPSHDFLNETRKIEGFIMKSIKNIDLKEAGLRCTACYKDLAFSQLNYVCINCSPKFSMTCSICSKNSINECYIKKHMIVVQNNAFRIWFENLSNLEYKYFDIFRKNSILKNNCNQGDMFYKTHDYQKAIQCYLEILKKDTREISSIHNNNNEIYNYKIENDQDDGCNTKLSYTRQNIFDKDQLYKANLCKNIGSAYDYIGEYDNAIKWYIELLKITQERVGEDHPDLVVCYNNIALAYEHKGEYNKAIKLCTKSLKIIQNKLGEDHIATAEYYKNIALIYNSKGEYDKATIYSTKSLKIIQKILGEDHPDMAGIYMTISLIYGNKKEYGKAMQYNTKSLKIFQNILGEDHTYIAESYNIIGVAYYYQGKYDEGLKYFTKSLEISQNIFRKDHPFTAVIYCNIGSIYWKKGKYDKSMKYYTKALEICQKMLGDNHPITAVAYNGIGLVYDCKGNYDTAMKYLTRSLEIRQNIFGENHPNTAVSYNDIGLVYDHKGEYDTAMKNLTISLEIRQKMLGEDHPDIAESYNNIGLIHDSKGEYDKAIKCYIKSLEISLNIFGEDHLEMAECYNNIGLAYAHKREYNKAMEYHKKSLKICQNNIGEDHPLAAMAYNNIGLVYQYKGEYIKAMKYYTKSLEIRKKMLGEDHPDTAASYNNIGLIYYFKKEYDKAIKYYTIALKIRKSLLSEDHPDIAAFYNNIGLVYYQKREYEKALKYYAKSLQIKQSILGENHYLTAVSYNNIALVYNIKREYDKTLKYNLKSLRIRQKIFGEDHPDTAASYDNIGLFYATKGEYDKAIKYHIKSLEIYQKILGNEHPDTIDTSKNIINVINKMFSKNIQ